MWAYPPAAKGGVSIESYAPLSASGGRAIRFSLLPAPLCA